MLKILSTCLEMILVIPTAYASSNSPAKGKSCTQIGVKTKATNAVLVCAKSGKSLKWTVFNSKVTTKITPDVQNIFENQICPSFEENYSFLGHGLTGTFDLTCKNINGLYKWIARVSTDPTPTPTPTPTPVISISDRLITVTQTNE